MTTQLKTQVSKDGKGLRCGRPRCVILGDIRWAGLNSCADLLEGYRCARDGVAKPHKHAQKRYRGFYKRDPLTGEPIKVTQLPMKDAHARWVGGVPDPDKRESWQWGAGAGVESIPGGPQRERQRYRERVYPGDEVKCHSCGFINIVDIPLDKRPRAGVT